MICVHLLSVSCYHSGTMSAFPDDRRDLAAMFVPLARALVAREEPALTAHNISMWGYIVLTALSEQPVRTQAALARPSTRTRAASSASWMSCSSAD